MYKYVLILDLGRCRCNSTLVSQQQILFTNIRGSDCYVVIVCDAMGYDVM